MPGRAHARLGASGAYRWLRCPGSVRLSEGRPDESTAAGREGTAAGREGTVAHEWAERTLRGGAIEDVPADMRAGVGLYVDTVRALVAESGGWLQAERRISLEALRPPEDMFGTTDASIVQSPTRLHIVDFKYGRYVVEVENNPQLLYYLLGALLELPAAARARIRELRITIVQPRAAHPDGPVRSVEVSWPLLVLFAGRLMAGAYRTQMPDAPLRPGDWCRFCRAREICPALEAARA